MLKDVGKFCDVMKKFWLTWRFFLLFPLYEPLTVAESLMHFMVFLILY